MRIAFSFKKNNGIKSQNKKINFGAGLTPKMMQEIQKADVLEISNKLAEKGIPTDFKDNKVIAWCCQKVVSLFTELNNKYNLNLDLPNSIIVENFSHLKSQNTDMAVCNWFPTNLFKDSDRVTPEKSIVFNNRYNWENINGITDKFFESNYWGNNHFLYFFTHEFCHVAHEGHLSKRMNPTKMQKIINHILQSKEIAIYQEKYLKKTAKICRHALNNPLEAVACDMSRVIADSLDKNTLMPTKNPFIGTPYEKLSFWQRVNLPEYSDEERPLKEILRNFWNGKFD